jgi:hypothetical protein
METLTMIAATTRTAGMPIHKSSGTANGFFSAGFAFSFDAKAGFGAALTAAGEGTMISVLHFGHAFRVPAMLALAPQTLLQTGHENWMVFSSVMDVSFIYLFPRSSVGTQFRDAPASQMC